SRMRPRARASWRKAKCSLFRARWSRCASKRAQQDARALERGAFEQKKPDVEDEVADRRANDRAGACPQPGKHQRGEEDGQPPRRRIEQVAERKQERSHDGGASERGTEDAHPRRPALLEAQRQVTAVEEFLGERDRGIPRDPAGELQRIRSDTEAKRVRR